ncbi:hypothetical protein JOF29_004634 [Kribbella aluminosa]|uniref:Lipoprotein n=1 Tax=Kribbella aluminosa TaxID=416017 RepID=A0ABS4UPG2_9ACTN|nr:hypothetical protein [Kribbella aluminosa]MBP2353524.1 hypothetical protein [Kribbella aluminosa]
MKLRAAIAIVAAIPLVLGLTACDHKPTGYRPSVPVSTTNTAQPAK